MWPVWTLHQKILSCAWLDLTKQTQVTGIATNWLIRTLSGLLQRWDQQWGSCTRVKVSCDLFKQLVGTMSADINSFDKWLVKPLSFYISQPDLSKPCLMEDNINMWVTNQKPKLWIFTIWPIRTMCEILLRWPPVRSQMNVVFLTVKEVGGRGLNPSSTVHQALLQMIIMTTFSLVSSSISTSLRSRRSSLAGTWVRRPGGSAPGRPAARWWRGAGCQPPRTSATRAVPPANSVVCPCSRKFGRSTQKGLISNSA